MKEFKILRNHSVPIVVLLLLIVSDVTVGKRIFSGSRKSSPSRSTASRVTPSYSSRSSSNSHADAAKLSYPNYNSQPNKAASAPSSNHGTAPAYGWNVPKNQGPPPAYSPHNPVGGAKTNLNEKPPAYNPSYASGSNVHAPISATNMRNSQSGIPAGATYHSPGNLPAGATYHSPGNLPAGATYHSPGNIPAGASYHPSGYPTQGGGYHQPSYNPGYHAPPPSYGGGYHPSPAQMPAGATYLQPGSALPAGAVFMSQPPRSSGLGFGSGLLAGGLGGAVGGALLANALTPSHHGSSYGSNYGPQFAPAPAGGDSGGGDRIIIINNGQPVNVSEAGPGTTVINTGGQAQAPAPAQGPAVAPESMPPLAPMSADAPNAPAGVATAAAGVAAAAATPDANAGGAPAPNAEPAPGGIICVPVRVNDTDPNDPTKMIEVEKIACYPAPPPEQQQAAATDVVQQTPQAATDETSSSQVPLAPLQTIPTQSTLVGNDALVRSNAPQMPNIFSFKMGMALSSLWTLIYASRHSMLF